MMRIFLIIYCCLIFVSCNESLPVHEDLSNLVTTNVRSRYYTLSSSKKSGALQLFITMVNNSDETLDDIVQLNGSVEVSWQPSVEENQNFTKTRTIKLSRNNIMYAKSYDRISHRLRVEPKDSIVLNAYWNFKTDDSTDLLMHFPTVNDPGCYVKSTEFPPNPDDPIVIIQRRISLPQRFVVSANIKYFDKLAAAYSVPVTIKQCVMATHFGEENSKLGLPPCVDFSNVDPCTVIK